jgi:hypothetical protein
VSPSSMFFINTGGFTNASQFWGTLSPTSRLPPWM